MGMATKQILSGIGHRGPRTGRETRRREREGGAYGGDKTAGSKHQGEQNRVPISGIMIVCSYDICIACVCIVVSPSVSPIIKGDRG